MMAPVGHHTYVLILVLLLAVLRGPVEKNVPHFAVMVPYALFHQLSHGAHVEALEGG